MLDTDFIIAKYGEVVARKKERGFRLSLRSSPITRSRVLLGDTVLQIDA